VMSLPDDAKPSARQHSVPPRMPPVIARVA
jgi:hypothetical protein